MSNTNTLALVPVALVLALVFGLSAGTAFAASEYAATNEAFVQGMQKDGDPVDGSRSNPAEALGAPDNTFVSLGYGGEIWLGFSQNMSGNLSLAVQEVTGGSYPLETADVYVSTGAAGPWTFVGTASNEEGTDDGLTEISGIEQCFQYVRIVDTTDENLHNNNSDGFDVDAVEATYDEMCPKPMGSSDVRVKNSNIAIVKNITEVEANTGGNNAEGSTAGAGGDGGDIENEGDGNQRVRGSHTGNGGRGGNSSDGGFIQTGNANAGANVTNNVNSNDTVVDSCGCEGNSRVRVRNHNFAMVMNHTGSGANTGDNWTGGSDAGAGGDGGDIENDGGYGEQESRYYGSQRVRGSSTGNGAAGGDSGIGGTVFTGDATARATVENTVNTNRTRVR